MRRSQFLVPAMLALLLVLDAFPGVAQPVPHPERLAPPTGGVYVTTLPIGADIWLDGVYVGRSPAFVDALMPGRHAITATKTGWESRELDVTILAGETQASSIALSRLRGTVRPATGKIALLGLRAIREVSVDGQNMYLDAGGTVTTNAGTHGIVVHAEGGIITRQVTVYPDMTTSVVVHGNETDATPAHIAVVAPASDFLPSAAYQFDATNVYIKYHRHEVSARIGVSTVRLDGEAISYDAAPAFIDGKLYLPLELLQRISEPPKPK